MAIHPLINSPIVSPACGNIGKQASASVPTPQPPVFTVEQAREYLKATMPIQATKQVTDHSFSKVLAKEYGIPAALIAKYLAHRIKRSTKVYDGRNWHYETVEELTTRYPYLSATSIYNAINKLKEKLIMVSRYNKWPGDRTSWFSFQSPDAMVQAEKNLLYFDPNDAAQYGIPAALVLGNLTYWIDKNRKTNPEYRWHPLSVSKLEKFLPLSRSTLLRVLKTLVETRVLLQNPEPKGSIPEYALNPTPETSMSNPNMGVSKENEPVSKQNEPVSDRNEVVSKANDPVSNQNDKVSKQNEPVSNQNDPASNRNMEVSKRNQPVSNRNDYTYYKNIIDTLITPLEDFLEVSLEESLKDSSVTSLQDSLKDTDYRAMPPQASSLGNLSSLPEPREEKTKLEQLTPVVPPAVEQPVFIETEQIMELNTFTESKENDPCETTQESESPQFNGSNPSARPIKGDLSGSLTNPSSKQVEHSGDQKPIIPVVEDLQAFKTEVMASSSSLDSAGKLEGSAPFIAEVTQEQALSTISASVPSFSQVQPGALPPGDDDHYQTILEEVAEFLNTDDDSKKTNFMDCAIEYIWAFLPTVKTDTLIEWYHSRSPEQVWAKLGPMLVDHISPLMQELADESGYQLVRRVIRVVVVEAYQRWWNNNYWSGLQRISSMVATYLIQQVQPVFDRQQAIALQAAKDKRAADIETRRSIHQSKLQHLEEDATLTASKKVEVLQAALTARNQIGCCGTKTTILENFITMEPHSLRAAQRFFAANPSLTASILIGLVDQSIELKELQAEAIDRREMPGEKEYDPYFNSRGALNLSFLLIFLEKIIDENNLLDIPSINYLNKSELFGKK